MKSLRSESKKLDKKRQDKKGYTRTQIFLYLLMYKVGFNPFLTVFDDTQFVISMKWIPFPICRNIPMTSPSFSGVFFSSSASEGLSASTKAAPSSPSSGHSTAKILAPSLPRRMGHLSATSTPKNGALTQNE